MSGQPEGWRIRIGDYRVIYMIDDKAETVTVVRVKHRREVYR
jgi:mRNA interferase RelE/StbE